MVRGAEVALRAVVGRRRAALGHDGEPAVAVLAVTLASAEPLRIRRWAGQDLLFTGGGGKNIRDRRRSVQRSGTSSVRTGRDPSCSP